MPPQAQAMTCQVSSIFCDHIDVHGCDGTLTGNTPYING